MNILNTAMSAFKAWRSPGGAGTAAVAKGFGKFNPASDAPPGERGDRVASDVAMERLYRQMWVDTERRALIRQIRLMDATDPRVKRIHARSARDTIRGGLIFQGQERHSSETLKREWTQFKGRLQLDIEGKLKSDARGFVMEGNLPLQLVLNANNSPDVVAAIRMPSDTMVPITDMGGRFKNSAAAWEQRDVMTNQVLASFGAWQLVMSRLDPDNFDDMGAMGRPFLDACVTTWQKLTMTEEDLVIRRRMRAPLRLSHVLEGADDTAMQTYRKTTENEKGEITTDFYSNRKGGVTAVQGDSGMGEMTDVIHLMDTFLSGTPLPKALLGYTSGLSRDILEDLKRDYYDEVDGIQDSLATGYMIAFRIHLLFKGIDPDTDEFALRFAQRRTETPNQVADLALKYIAAGLPEDMVYADMGLDPDYVRQKKEEQAARKDPYPPAGGDPGTGGGKPGTKVNVTPGNARKGESATSISNAGGNGGRGRA
ncbi:hypothetical protein [Polaromonas sp.]|uniref:hypothetical protein n=1 Tax=Polaromonas sp. TaxID=1869339 RepID=UPI00272F7E53|nr:hypothetical protein [Polaromonas sp.]MDP1886664.1 hypothetical protein [Polaromonas sp.]